MSELNLSNPLHVIGGGLAGCEAAWQAARAGLPVVLHEMRPVQKTAAHETDQLAELVCSNSLRSDDHQSNAVGLLHEELRHAGSLIMQAADQHKIPAGTALAVDRHAFSLEVQTTLESLPNVTINRAAVETIPPADWHDVIIATGPLTSDALAAQIGTLTDEAALAFFDAIAPVIYTDSIDFDKAWFQSRYDKSSGDGDGKDYINCPLNESQYNNFINALLDGDKVPFKDWEKDTPYFEGCLPIEVMAERGPETLRYGPLKPVGLTNPHMTEKPYAVVQLRQDNALGSLYNMVGFQTKLTHGEQTRIFRTLPGLENARFARLGGIHRNTFLNSPRLLDRSLRLKAAPHLRFAGQITGVEGYVESAAMGLLAGRFATAGRHGHDLPVPPPTTALGALLNHVTGDADADCFQPMNINFGLFPPLAQSQPPRTGKRLKRGERKLARKAGLSARALTELGGWLQLPENALWQSEPVR